MHLVFYIRGVPQQVELWKAMAQNQFFKWRRTNLKTNEEEIILVQGGLRDSVLGTMEFTFPEESLPTVLRIMNLKYGRNGVEKSIMINVRLDVLRGIIGLRKIPKKAFKEAEKIEPSVMFDELERGLSDLTGAKVSIHPIGIKKDRRGKMENPINGECWLQELI